MDKSISGSIPVIQKAIFTLDIDNVKELFSIIEDPFNMACNGSAYICEIDDDSSPYLQEERIQRFKEDIVHFLLIAMLYSDYSTCQDLTVFFDHLEAMTENELHVELSSGDVDLTDPEYIMPSHASPMIHFLFNFLGLTDLEEHERITQILKDIELIDQMDITIDWDDVNLTLTSEQIQILSTIEL